MTMHRHEDGFEQKVALCCIMGNVGSIAPTVCFYISSYKQLKASVASLSAVLHLSHNFMEERYIIAAVAWNSPT